MRSLIKFLKRQTEVEGQDMVDHKVEYEINKPSQISYSKKQLSKMFSNINIFENNAHLVAQIALEGIDPDDISIKVSGKTMVLKINQPEGTAFIRVVSLPIGVIADQTQAKYEDNNLSIFLPIAKAKEIVVQKAN